MAVNLAVPVKAIGNRCANSNSGEPYACKVTVQFWTFLIERLLIAGSPVRIKSGSFDDTETSAEQFYALNFNQLISAGKMSYFAFHRRRDNAVFFNVSGEEKRTMVGGRFAGKNEKWDINTQAGYQFGKNGSLDISAWGWIFEIGKKMDTLNGARLGLDIAVSSGDDDPNDGELNSFDPLYPNLAVLTSVPIYFPTNQIAIGVNLSKTFRKKLTLTGKATVIGRYSRDDAVYIAPGRAVENTNTDDRLTSILFEAKVRYRHSQNLTFDASFVHGEPSDTLKNVGGDSLNFGLIQATYEF